MTLNIDMILDKYHEIKIKYLVGPGANIIKKFYCHSTVILSFCAIKQNYLDCYCGRAVNYYGILSMLKNLSCYSNT